MKLKMHFIDKLILLDEAQLILAENTKEIETIEEVALLDATDRVLAEKIQTPFNVPPFQRAAMDGYAVKAATIADASESTPIVLNNIEKVLAGDVSQSELGDFDCIEIATGAMMPDSADTVVQVEMTSANENQISIIKALTERNQCFKSRCRYRSRRNYFAHWRNSNTSSNRRVGGIKYY